MKTLEEQLTEANAALADVTARLAKADADLSAAVALAEEANSGKDALAAQITDLKRQLSDAGDNLAGAQAQLSAVTKERDGLREAAATAEKRAGEIVASLGVPPVATAPARAVSAKTDVSGLTGLAKVIASIESTKPTKE